MDQGLKERLIGAAVLVALAAWIVPLVLDGDGNSDGEGAAEMPLLIDLPVPDEPLPVQRQTLNLTPPPAVAEPPTPGPRAAEPPPAAPRVAESPGSAPSAANTPEPIAERPAMAAAAERRPAPTPATPVAQPQPRAAAPSAAAQAARAPSAAGAWQVQLGSFSEEENALRLVQRVSTFGSKAAVSNVRSNGRTMYRVRVGPHATREEASAVASALSAHGFVAQVVAAD